MICLLLTSKILSGHFSFPREANPSLRCRFKSSWPPSPATAAAGEALLSPAAVVDSEIRKLFTATTTSPPPPLCPYIASVFFSSRTEGTSALCFLRGNLPLTAAAAAAGKDKPRHLLCSEGKPYRPNQRCMEPCLWSFIVFISKSTAPRGTLATAREPRRADPVGRAITQQLDRPTAPLELRHQT